MLPLQSSIEHCFKVVKDRSTILKGSNTTYVLNFALRNTVCPVQKSLTKADRSLQQLSESNPHGWGVAHYVQGFRRSSSVQIWLLITLYVHSLKSDRIEICSNCSCVDPSDDRATEGTDQRTLVRRWFSTAGDVWGSRSITSTDPSTSLLSC